MNIEPFTLKDLNPRSLINIIPSIMEALDKTSLSGADKKTRCLDILYTIINNSNLNDSTKSYLTDIVNEVYDPVVENIIAVSKKQYDINKTVNCFIGLLKGFQRCWNYNSTL